MTMPDAEAPAVQLTAEEIAEYRQLRRERIEREAAELEARKVEEARRTPPTHHVRLADGQLVQLSGGNIGTHHSFGDGTGRPDGDKLVAVASAYEI